MTFKNPYFLLLGLVALAAVMAAHVLRSKTKSVMSLPAPAAQFMPLPTLYAQLGYLLPALIRGAALLLLVLALARPQKVTRTALPPTEGVDIMLCLDTSPSMQALDFDPYTRLDAAKNTARDFINKRVNDRIGIVAFAGSALLQCPLTLDYGSLLEFLDQVYIGITHTDGTAIGDAIATSVNHLKNSPAKSKVIVLLTDGRSNTGIITDPALAARAAASYGIKIYTVGTAGKGPAKVLINDPVFGQRYVYQPEDLDEDTLLAIARETGGAFFRAKNYAELQDIYAKINALETTEFKNPVSINYEDEYALFLVPAILLMIAGFVLEKLVFLRIP